ncbi:MAG: hypothetical protein M1829_004093 [Trizodia sp. TS-e1964]|nr:MAG: hypothetical protein M1829_004093 [Trizodia sp. TS-e1964]
MYLDPRAIQPEEHVQQDSPNDDRSRAVIAVNCGVLVVASIAVTLRVLARRIKGAPLLRDDYTCFFALAVAYTIFIFCLVGIHYGLGRHIWTLSDDQVKHVYLSAGMFEILYVICVTATKMSILFMYARIFVTTVTPRFRAALYIVGVIVLAYGISFTFSLIFQCRPLAYAFDKTIPGGDCVNVGSLFISAALINIASDITILVLPMPLIFRLWVSQKQKAAVAGIFLLGGFVCIASIVRLWVLANTAVILDTPWGIVDFMLWSIIEPSIGIVCACIPVMGPLLRNVIVRSPNGSFKLSLASWISPTEAGNSAAHQEDIGRNSLVRLDGGGSEWELAAVPANTINESSNDPSATPPFNPTQPLTPLTSPLGPPPEPAEKSADALTVGHALTVGESLTPLSSRPSSGDSGTWLPIQSNRPKSGWPLSTAV